MIISLNSGHLAGTQGARFAIINVELAYHAIGTRNTTPHGRISSRSKSPFHWKVSAGTFYKLIILRCGSVAGCPDDLT